jgi:hypothetical protein
MRGIPNGNIPPQRPTPTRPATGPGVEAATVQDARPASAEPPQGDPERANACSRLKEFLKSLPAKHKGFAYLYAAAGGAGTGAKVGAVFTLGHPIGTGAVSATYMLLALIARATKDNHKDISEAIMNLEGLTSEAAGTAMKSGPWGLRFVMWTLQSADVIEHAKANGLNDFQAASLVGFTGGFSVLTHTLVIAAMIDLIACADKIATRTLGGALEAAGTPLRTLAPDNWGQSVTFGFAQPAILGWAVAVGTGNADMLIGGAAKWLTKSVGEAVVVQSGIIATTLVAAGTGYARHKGVKFAPIKIDASMMNELRTVGVPLMVSGARMARVAPFEFAPSQTTCKQVMKDLAQAAFSPPVMFGIATFANYYLAKNPDVDLMGLFMAADTGTQPPVDGGDDIHRIAGRILVSTLPYAAGWILELVKGWDLSRSPDGVKKLDQVMPTKLGDLEQTLFCLMTAGSVAWTTEVLGTPDVMEAGGMTTGLGVLLSVMVPFGGLIASARLVKNSEQLAADAVVTLAAGVLGGLEPDLHGKEIMLGTLGLWMGGRAFLKWSTENGPRTRAADLAQLHAWPAGLGGVAVPQAKPLAPAELSPMAAPSLVNDGTSGASDLLPLLSGFVRATPRAEQPRRIVYSEAAVEIRRQAISRLMGIRYHPGANLPGDGSRSSSGAGIALPAGTTWEHWMQRVNAELGPPPWDDLTQSSDGTPPMSVTNSGAESKKADSERPVPPRLHIDAAQVQQHLEAASLIASTAAENRDVSIHLVSPDFGGGDPDYKDEAFSTNSEGISRTAESRSEISTDRTLSQAPLLEQMQKTPTQTVVKLSEK